MIRHLRRTLTLIELLIVITLIGIIGSALAYNLGAGLNKGKEFRTEQTKRKIKNILDYEVFNNNRLPQDAPDQWKDWLRESELVDKNQKLEDLFKDGYGGEFKVDYDEAIGQITVTSSKDAQKRN